MQNLDCNQIMIFINLEIIGEEKYIYFLKKIYKNFYNLVKSLGATKCLRLNQISFIDPCNSFYLEVFVFTLYLISIGGSI